MNSRSKLIIIISSILIIIIVVMILVYFFYESDEVKETKNYNKAVLLYNEMLVKYNEVVEISSIDNLEGCVVSTDKLEVVSENKKDVLKSVEDGNSLYLIKKHTQTVIELTSILENSIEIANQLYKPTCEFIKLKIEDIEKITDIEVVSDALTIEKYMGENNKCIGLVYFGLEYIDPTSVEGNSISEKGTDAGGSIEIFESVEDANNRVDYLGQFDDTYLYSGSYAIVGTAVVRTSFRLDNEKQLEITNKIFEELSKIEK